MILLDSTKHPVPKQALARRFAQRLVSPVRPHLNRAANIALARRLLGAPVPAPSRTKRCDIEASAARFLGSASPSGSLGHSPSRMRYSAAVVHTSRGGSPSTCAAVAGNVAPQVPGEHLIASE